MPEHIQEYIERVEDYVYTSVTSAYAEVPAMKDAIHRLWADVARFGPNMPEIHIPGLGDFEVPPAPPPPPPPKTFLDKSVEWVEDHPWTAAAGAGVLGAGLLIGYSTLSARGRTKLRKHKGAGSHERRQVVVVLGGDIPLAQALILDLEKKGFIVVVSVATHEAAKDLEHRGNGYVRALVLDPTDPETISVFLRSMASSLSKRFPINAAGDPHASPASLPYIHSVVSLLGLSSPLSPSPAPLEHLDLYNEYMPYLTATHITPLQVIQALLPLMRTSPARAQDAASNGKSKKSIVVCVPAADARVGLPFASASAMSAAATARGVEVLRPEIRMAASTGDLPSMADINVIVTDVGAIESPITNHRRAIGYDAHQNMEAWTPSERMAYGPAYASIVEGPDPVARRKPASVHVFVDGLVDIVLHGHKRRVSVFGIPLPLGLLTQWVSGGRYAVGAGATTYSLASYLPRATLDAILNLPYLLLSIRNTLLPIPPRVISSGPRSLPTASPAAPVTPGPASTTAQDSPPTSDQDHDSENGSEADVESNGGDGVGVGESWVSLKDKPNPWEAR
ncbi:hypothetical protein OF83DRAFT_1067259 [Amylostereum chailletii]|nr:hypothetical protein OF83DRAFT_1067259 [Amylostereum chailletii]